MSSLILNTQHISQLDPISITKDDLVRDKWIQVYSSIWGPSNAESAYAETQYYFNNALVADDRLRTCTRFSIFNAFIETAINNLSLRPGSRSLSYLEARGIRVGKDQTGRDIYEQSLRVVVSGYGELVVRQRAGQIRYADNPVIVYEGDQFSYGEQNGIKIISYMAQFPRPQGARIVAAYLKITRIDGSIDYSVMLPSDWQRLSAYSARNDRRNHQANDLYTSANGDIDPQAQSPQSAPSAPSGQSAPSAPSAPSGQSSPITDDGAF